jgi:cell division protein FtsB
MSVAPEVIEVLPDNVAEYTTRRSLAKRREHLRVVAPLRMERASRGMFVVVITLVLAIGLLIMLVINTALAQGAFAVTALQREIQVLSEREQTLIQEIAFAAGPVQLESAARELGMVASTRPVFLDIEAGRIVGKPKASRDVGQSGAPSVGADVSKAKRNRNGWSAPVILDGPRERLAPLEAVVVVDP